MAINESVVIKIGDALSVDLELANEKYKDRWVEIDVTHYNPRQEKRSGYYTYKRKVIGKVKAVNRRSLGSDYRRSLGSDSFYGDWFYNRVILILEPFFYEKETGYLTQKLYAKVIDFPLFSESDLILLSKEDLVMLIMTCD